MNRDHSGASATDATTMQSNAEIIRTAYEAFATGDVPAVLAVFAEDMVWHKPGRSPLSGDHVGHDEILAVFQQLGERSNGTFNLDVHDVLDSGDDTVVALVTEHGERNGARLDASAVHVWRVEDGKATRFQVFAADDYESDEFWS